MRVSQTDKQDMFNHRLVQLLGQSSKDPRKVGRYILRMFHIQVNNNFSARAPIPWKKKLVDSPSLCSQGIWCNYSQHLYLKWNCTNFTEMQSHHQETITRISFNVWICKLCSRYIDNLLKFLKMIKFQSPNHLFRTDSEARRKDSGVSGTVSSL